MARGGHSGTDTLVPRSVETVRVAKDSLSSYLKEARELGADAPPHFFGSHRKPEGVVLSYESYLRLCDMAENAEIAALVAERRVGRKESFVELDEVMEQLGIDPHEQPQV